MCIDYGKTVENSSMRRESYEEITDKNIVDFCGLYNASFECTDSRSYRVYYGVDFELFLF